VFPIAGAANRALVPVIALQLRFIPGAGWKSGFTIAPQLNWRSAAVGYVMVQFEGRLTPLLQGDDVEPLVVTMERPGGGAQLVCKPPARRLARLRRIALMALGTI